MSKGTKHKCDWKPTTLEVAIMARELCIHSKKIMGNKKVFDPADDWNESTLAELNRIFTSIYIETWAANRIDLRKEPWRKADRLGKQEKAILLCGDAYPMMEMAKSQFHLSSKKFWNWANLLYDVEQKLIAWHTADVKRYEDI